MLFLITGASGSGKSACIPHLKRLIPDILIHDVDELGVPDGADAVWRQRITEKWILQALVYQWAGHDMVLCGNTVLGEVLASPSAPALDGLATCLLDCHDVVRIDRLQGRGDDQATQDMLCWAAWQRMHAVDPQWRPDVIQDGSAPEMRWDRWHDWQRSDPRWDVWVLDTTELSVETVAERIATWVCTERVTRQPVESSL